MGCERRTARAGFQERLLRLNPDYAGLDAVDAPDGNADLVDAEFLSFVVPCCEVCGGVETLLVAVAVQVGSVAWP